MALNKIKTEGALSADVRKIINDNFNDESTVTTAFSQATNTTLANVVGLVSDTLQPGTYDVDINLITTAGATGGFKAALKWGTASMITSTSLAVTALSAAAVAQTNFTTSTDASPFVNAAAAYVNIKVRGTIVVAVAGTLQLQAAQNTSDATAATVALGSTMKLNPIGATTGAIV